MLVPTQGSWCHFSYCVSRMQGVLLSHAPIGVTNLISGFETPSGYSKPLMYMLKAIS